MDKPADAAYDIHPLIAKRWSPRAFSNKSIDREVVLSLLEAARWAASCFNEQPWSFLVATKDDPEAHAMMANCLVEKNKLWAEKAPVLMISLAHTTFARNGKPNRHARHDLGLAVGNLTIEAGSRDLWLHQMAGIHVDKIREVYGLPENIDPVAGIAIGYLGDADHLPDDLAEREHAIRQRKSQDAFVRLNPKGGVSF